MLLVEGSISFLNMDYIPGMLQLEAYWLKNAGGVVCDFNEGNDYIFGKQIVASNIHLYNPFMEILKKHLVN